MRTLKDKMVTHKARFIEAMRRAELDAIRNPHMRFTVYSNLDGFPATLEDMAGGSSYYPDYVPIYDICYQYYDMDDHTDYRGVHPYAYLRDNRDALTAQWEESFRVAVSRLGD